MLYFIENEQLKATISDRGAELFSVVSKENGCEYIWQGDAKYWEDRAPILFPICCRLFEGQYSYCGRKYFMDIHGFAKDNVFEITDRGDSFIELTLRANDDTQKIYPFDFCFKVRFTLCGNKLSYSMTVKNNETAKEMIYALGGHPGFNLPLDKESATELKDWYLEFDCVKSPKQISFTENCFRTGNDPEYNLEDGKIIRLSLELFDQDSIFLKECCKKVTLKSEKSERSVKLEFDDFDYLGLWTEAPLKAPFLCIEPMTGLPSFEGKVDDLETKADMMRLAAGETSSKGFDIFFN